ncbi:SMI1/KNR4 family protein [Flavobacterium sp. HJSW_4]|uniref:SMI1/KNR4 family protein n=1 Tax=Flavobacterium sp. HJSW_4 TaxID=3344660 RepID=UPI0035F461B1
MNLETAILEIKKFWNTNEEFSFGKSKNQNHVERLENEFGVAIPDSLKEYITNFASLNDFYFTTVGNPICIYGVDNLKFKQDGYNFNPVKNTKIEDWNESFFILADEGADPVIIDLSHPENGIQKLMHGAGSWDYGETIADSIGQFLLCSAAIHHALTNFEEESIIDDENGFNLAENAAKWYFKNMKNWAGNYYSEWCSIFDNH